MSDSVSLAAVLEQVTHQRNRAMDEAAQWAAKAGELAAEVEQLRAELDRLKREHAGGDGVSGSDA